MQRGGRLSLPTAWWAQTSVWKRVMMQDVKTETQHPKGGADGARGCWEKACWGVGTGTQESVPEGMGLNWVCAPVSQRAARKQ